MSYDFAACPRHQELRRLASEAVIAPHPAITVTHEDPAVTLFGTGWGVALAAAVDRACRRSKHDVRIFWSGLGGIAVHRPGPGQTPETYGLDLARLARDLDLGLGPRRGLGLVDAGPEIAWVTAAVVEPLLREGTEVAWVARRGLVVQSNEQSVDYGADLGRLVSDARDLRFVAGSGGRIFPEPFNFLGGAK